MARRFSQIRRGAEYNEALDNYVAYIRNAETRPTKRMRGGIRGTRRQTIAASVRPFGVELASGVFASTRVGQESATELAATVSGRLFTSGTQLSGARPLAGFRPAKISAFRGTGAAAYVQSKVTKLYYLKYAGDSFSVPFGATADAEEEAAGGAVVKAAVLALFGGADIKRASISPERVKV
jgi:hypothetical protein